MDSLDNGRISIAVAERGAELISLRDLESGMEYIWSGDESIWRWHAPVLFPICGNFPDGYIHNGQHYSLPMHGFLRDRIHQKLGDGRFLYSSQGEDGYPFAFSARTDFILEGKSLVHRLTIENRGNVPMPCSLGFHTGYLVERPTIEFECEEPSLGGRIFECNDESLACPILLTGLKSKSLVARDAKGKALRISSPSFSTLVIWSPKGHAGDFVCIEPRVDTVPSGAREPFALSVAPGKEAVLEEVITALS